MSSSGGGGAAATATNGAARVAPAPTATRRHLTDRQARTVAGLVEAAVVELGETGYAALTVRGVAHRAGVAPATAYTYFASKEHLVAEVYWRRFNAQAPPPVDRRRSLVNRAAEVLSGFALVVAEETDLAAACTVALMADDPEVADLRARIGTELHRRLAEALEPDVTPAQLMTLELAVSGLLVQVGTGHMGYGAVPAHLTEVAGTVLGGRDR